MALYDATGGESRQNNSSWGTSAPLREWHGVKVTDRDRVIMVELRENGMVGELPRAFFDLTALETLALVKNEICGPLLPEVGNRRNLARLFLEFNEISGPIPKEIEGPLNHAIPSFMPKQAWLQCTNNQLSGTIPI
ncbi:unnamed protein product [Ectocarpus sp. 8 AP-2014]